MTGCVLFFSIWSTQCQHCADEIGKKQNGARRRFNTKASRTTRFWPEILTDRTRTWDGHRVAPPKNRWTPDSVLKSGERTAVGSLGGDALNDPPPAVNHKTIQSGWGAAAPPDPHFLLGGSRPQTSRFAVLLLPKTTRSARGVRGISLQHGGVWGAETPKEKHGGLGGKGPPTALRPCRDAKIVRQD